MNVLGHSLHEWVIQLLDVLGYDLTYRADVSQGAFVIRTRVDFASIDQPQAILMNNRVCQMVKL